MKKILKFSYIAAGFLLMTGCAGSKKFDYQSAYKFSYYNYAKADHEKKAVFEEADAGPLLEASNSIAPVPVEIKSGTEALPDVLPVPKTHEKTAYFDRKAFLEEYRQMSRQEKRQLRKSLRAELKSLRRNPSKSTLEVNNVAMTQAEGDFLWLAILLGGIGLILLILGAIFAVGFLTVIGALGIVAGAVFFILEFT